MWSVCRFLDVPSTSKCIQVFRCASYLPRKTNYYGVLGVKSTATMEEIKTAFVAKSNELHPDGRSNKPSDERVGWSTQSDTEKFMLVKEAYDCLRKPEKRKAYDDKILSTGGGGYLMEAKSPKFKEPSIIELNRTRNSSYMGPGRNTASSNGHFRNPEREYLEEKRKNRGFVYIAVFFGICIFGNLTYVMMMHRGRPSVLERRKQL